MPDTAFVNITGDTEKSRLSVGVVACVGLCVSAAAHTVAVEVVVCHPPRFIRANNDAAVTADNLPGVCNDMLLRVALTGDAGIRKLVGYVFVLADGVGVSSTAFLARTVGEVVRFAHFLIILVQRFLTRVAHTAHERGLLVLCVGNLCVLGRARNVSVGGMFARFRLHGDSRRRCGFARTLPISDSGGKDILSGGRSGDGVAVIPPAGKRVDDLPIQ